MIVIMIHSYSKYWWIEIMFFAYVYEIFFSYDDSTSLSARRRSRSFLILGPSLVLLLALGLTVLLLEQVVDSEDTLVIVGFLITFEVFANELDVRTDDELTDIFSCNPVWFIFECFCCLLLTLTCELRVDWFPIVTSSGWRCFNPDLSSRMLVDCSSEGISVLAPPIYVVETWHMFDIWFWFDSLSRFPRGGIGGGTANITNVDNQCRVSVTKKGLFIQSKHY